MPRVSSCPQGDAIDRYLDDRLPAAESSGLETHLSSCPACEDRLRTALKSDPLLPLARSGPGGSWSVPVVLRNRLLDLCAASTDTNGTVAQDTRPVTAFERPPELVAVLHPPQGSDEIGRLPGYRILKVLGKGGMGVVCLGVDEKLNRRVAIKLILPGMAADPRATAMFLREARALAAAPHDNVVTVFQVGQDGETPFLVMEFLEGETVAHWMKNNPSRCLGDVLRIAREAIAGLAYAHSKGVIHRDFKPANLWRTAGSGRVKLLDFGLARQPENEPLTAPGQVMGTAAYMAPEQAKGAAVDARADLFSFGVVLHELCSGVSPFARPHYINSLVAVSEYHPDPLDRTHPWLPADLVALATGLLAKDPAARVQTAAAVAARLRRIEEGAAKAGLLNERVGEADEHAPIDLDSVAEPAAPAVRRKSPRRRAWAVGLAFGLLAAMGLVWAAISNRPNDKAQQPKEPPAPLVPLPPEPPIAIKAGDPMSGIALTRKPKAYPNVLSWTLETVRHRKPVAAFAFQPGGTLFATGSNDGTIRVYDAKTWQLVKAIVAPSDVRLLAWSRDGKQLIGTRHAVSFQKTLAWDLDTGKVVREFSHSLGSLAVSPDGNLLSGTAFLPINDSALPTGGGVTQVVVENLSQGLPAVSLELPDTHPVSVSWHPESKHLMVGYSDGEIRIWDVAAKKVVRNVKSGFTSLRQVGWSPDGKKWAVLSGSMQLAVWFGDKRIELQGEGDSFAWSPTGDHLVGVCHRGSMKVFDTRNEDCKFEEFKDDQAVQATWSPDGKRIALMGREPGRVIDLAGKTVHNFSEDASAYNAEEGWFREPKDGKPAFVFVIQTDKGQETLTPAEFAKRTGWKNQPEKVFVP